MEWAEKVVNSKPQKRAPIEGFAGRKFVNLPHEVMLLEELGRDAASIENQAPKTALDLSSVENFRQLTLNIVRQNGGIFPGDKALWLATVALWLRSEGPSLEFLPESKYSRQACDDLLASRELFKIEHTFRAKGSRKGTRPFVHTPGFDLASPSVDFTKTKIAEAHTDYYVPLEYVLPKEIADRVQKTARGRSAVTFEESAIKMPAGKDVYYYDDESDYEEGDIPMRLERRISSASSNLSTDVLPAPRARAPSFTLVSDEDDNRQPGTTGRPLKIPSRNQEWKDSAGRVLKERWAAAHSLGLRTLKKDAVRGTPAPKATYVPWSKHYNDHLSSHGWQPFVASFPDPNTGAWADGPIKRKHRSYRTKNTRHRGPEPITIMQEGSGAWSQRTFGHGVEPIFARPGRITSKEKAEEITNYYQRLLDGGFRPVVLPSKSTAGNLDIDLQPRDPSRLPQRPCGDLLPSIEPGVGMYVDMYANIPNEYVATQSSNERRESSTPMSGRDHYDEYGPRISRATGIRIPSYPLKHFTLSDDDSDGVGEVDFQRVETRRMTRTSRRAAEASVQLPYNEQLELEVVPRKQNPGLETVPKAFGIEGYSLAAEFELGSEYSPKHNSLEFIKPELTYNHCTLGEGSWVSSEWYIPLPKNVRIRFRQNRTMENLLYDDLKSDEDEELPSKPRAKRRKVGEKGAIVDPKFKTMRIQTGAITDFQGLVKDANEARRRFDVEVSEYKVGTRRDDGKRFEAKMTAQVQQRLIATIIAVKVIAGGIDGFIDWVVIVTMFPEFSMGRLARYWPSLRESHGQVIERITEDFQAAFPTAYKNGEVPAMNYDHLLDYDWSAVIDWMYANIDVTLDKKSIVLPGSRKGINEKFHIRPPEDISGKLREQTFSRFTPLIKKLEIWAGVGHVIPMKSRKALQNENTNDLDGLMIARSIVRATAITPEEYWNQRVAKERLEGLGVNYLQDALAALQSEKVIVHVKKGRATPGRSYEATFLFGQKLNRNIPAQQFIDALNFKEHLDTLHAKDINTRIRLERNCNEGTIMCITSLQAVGQLKLEAKNVPGDKMYGLTGDDQDVRRIPREKLYFDLDLLFTSLYVPNNRISVLNTLPRTRPARPDGPEIPIWMSITGRLLPKMWKDVFSTVSQTMALRSGISTKGLRETFRPSLEEWEIKMLLRWGEELGIFQRLSKRIDGWTVGEDWWLGVAWLEKNM
ncbi:hypothetical protein BJ875DRAFT_459649 [Amylocarpus encephaloides]|uniref:Transcription factor tau subunit sfc3/Tfc3 C-terminal domain-containing protein n=1 Tax=Amylocarpus encephaloides TaxID=45428 RepID=A0A9P7YK25_9HELO|nr:hypothetical protein BJ875DRAFT_459649 [Amylocarpus encephaloides]